MARTSTYATDKAKTEALVQFSTYIPPELKMEISIKAAELRTQPSKLIAKLLAETFPVRESILNPAGDKAEA